MVSIATEGSGREDAAPSGARSVNPWVRWALLGLVAAALALALWFGLPGKLSLTALRSERASLIAFVHAHPWQSLAAYIVAYILVVGLSLPGALVMTLTGGFLFGTLEGGAAAVAAVSAGSVLMFLAAQTAVGDGLRDWLRGRSHLMDRMEREVRHHPFTSMLTLRLIPAAPLVLVNLAAGFVRMPLAPYALATVIGVMPSTFLYASVGAGLEDLFTSVQPGALMGVIQGELVLPVAGLLCLAAAPLGVRWWMARRKAP
ncbi:MAG: VTT domain-containing protein [Pseudomonadota bacterium]|nr:VTT domain-containing protein [Pseudomonadota bacterium]